MVEVRQVDLENDWLEGIGSRPATNSSTTPASRDTSWVLNNHCGRGPAQQGRPVNDLARAGVLGDGAIRAGNQRTEITETRKLCHWTQPKGAAAMTLLDRGPGGSGSSWQGSFPPDANRAFGLQLRWKGTGDLRLGSDRADVDERVRHACWWQSLDGQSIAMDQTSGREVIKLRLATNRADFCLTKETLLGKRSASGTRGS